MSTGNEKPKPQRKICGDCREEILNSDPTRCPYCGSVHLLSRKEYVQQKIPDIEKLERAGKYEDAALEYEELEMWDKAGEVRRKAKPNSVISANSNIGKVSSISLECPRCGASQPLSSKTNEVTCKHCGKNYGVPKKVLELL
jgi:DNA-directed RNA polymerase subunit RPC12/RpoP